MPGAGPNDSTGVTATKSEGYAIAGFCLAVGLIVLILAALLYQQSSNFSDPKAVVKGVAKANGVSGSISDSQLTINFTSDGLLSGPGFHEATGSDVTRTKLTGFVSDDANDLILPTDTILSASQNVVVMAASPLEVEYNVGTIVPANTIVEASSHLNGQVSNYAPKFSMWNLQTSLGQGTVIIPLVPSGSYHGSLDLPASTILPGTTMKIWLNGDIYSTASVIGIASNLTFTMSLIGSDASVIAYATVTNVASTTSYSTNGNPFTIEFTLSFISPTESSCFATYKRYLADIASPSQAIVAACSQTKPSYNPLLAYTFDFTGKSNSTQLYFGVNSIVCKQAIGIMV